MENQVLSIEQMQELKDLGINILKTYMYWDIPNIKYPRNKNLCIGTISPNYVRQGDDVISTITLQDILEILPKVIITKENNFELYLNTYQCYIQYRDSKHNKMLNVEFGDYILEAAFNMLKWCKQNNYI